MSDHVFTVGPGCTHYEDWLDLIDPDTFIPTGLPYCDVQSLCETPEIVRNPLPEIPDVDVPDMCFCGTLSLNIDFDFTALNAVIKPTAATVCITPVTKDCCIPGWDLDLDLDVPCVGFDLAMDATAVYTTGLVVPEFVTQTMYKSPDECRVNVELELALPPPGDFDGAVSVLVGLELIDGNLVASFQDLNFLKGQLDTLGVVSQQTVLGFSSCPD